MMNFWKCSAPAELERSVSPCVLLHRVRRRPRTQRDPGGEQSGRRSVFSPETLLPLSQIPLCASEESRESSTASFCITRPWHLANERMSTIGAFIQTAKLYLNVIWYPQSGRWVIWYNVNILQGDGLLHFYNNVVSGGVMDVSTSVLKPSAWFTAGPPPHQMHLAF